MICDKSRQYVDVNSMATGACDGTMDGQADD